MIHFTCDRCKKEVGDCELNKMKTEVRSPVLGWFEVKRDLCPTCWCIIKEIIDNPKEQDNDRISARDRAAIAAVHARGKVPYYD